MSVPYSPTPSHLPNWHRRTQYFFNEVIKRTPLDPHFPAYQAAFEKSCTALATSDPVAAGKFEADYQILMSRREKNTTFVPRPVDHTPVHVLLRSHSGPYLLVRGTYRR